MTDTRNDGCINNITALEVDGHCRRGRPRKTWRDTINDDLKNWKLTRVDPANRIEWRKKLRTNMGAVRPTLRGTSTLNEAVSKRFSQFSKFWFFGLLGESKGKNDPKWQKNMPLTPYLRNRTSYDCHFWYTCAKWWYP